MNQMTPIDWAKRPIEKYADFTGRASRPEFWWYVLAIIVASIITTIIDSIIGIKVAGPYGPLTLILSLGLLVPNIAVAVRRLHDTNRAGWWLLLLVPYFVGAAMAKRALMSGGTVGFGTGGLLTLVGLVGCVVLLVFYCLPGTPGDNRYGPNPDGSGSVVAE